jgi:dipeptidyl aminopeptidase/acylaminoacyl peptidase
LQLTPEFSNDEQVNLQTPITFLVQAENDDKVPLMNSINYFPALKKNNVKSELHIYEDGGHRFSLGNSPGNKNQTIACETLLRS